MCACICLEVVLIFPLIDFNVCLLAFIAMSHRFWYLLQQLSLTSVIWFRAIAYICCLVAIMIGIWSRFNWIYKLWTPNARTFQILISNLAIEFSDFAINFCIVNWIRQLYRHKNLFSERLAADGNKVYSTCYMSLFLYKVMQLELFQ